MSVKQKLVTAEELWEMPDVPGKRFELVDRQASGGIVGDLLDSLRR